MLGSVPKKQRLEEIPPTLEGLSASDLRFLCGFFRLSRGGGKADLIARLLASSYEVNDVLRTAAEVRFGARLAGFLPKGEVQEVLSENGLPIGGSRRELVLRLIENQLFDASALLALLSPAALKDLYYTTFERVSIAPRNHVIGELLASAEVTVARITQLQEPARQEFEYDVAISFAGEDRGVAKEVAERLTASGTRVFFDEFEQARLWGKDLATEFQKRYGPRTRFVIPLISRHYAIKDWTDYEFTIARQEARARGHEFILPVRLDDTPLVGLKSTIAYLDLKKEGVDGVVAKVMEKLDRKPHVQPARGSQSATAGPSPVIRPRTPFGTIQVLPVKAKRPLGKYHSSVLMCLPSELTKPADSTTLRVRHFGHKAAALSREFLGLLARDYRTGGPAGRPIELVLITEGALAELRDLRLPFFREQERE